MVDLGTSCNCRYIFGGDYMGAIATISPQEPEGDNPPENEAIANARLIAAAPDLLAENKRLREALEFYTNKETYSDKYYPKT
jgi:hypothetical protein